MSPELVETLSRLRAIEKTMPLLEAIRGVAEIALRRGEERVAPARAYAEAVRTLLGDLVGSLDPHQRARIWPERPGAPRGIVLLTSDRGLCGTFNARLVRSALRRRGELIALGHDVDLVCLGEKGRQLLTEAGFTVAFADRLPSLALPTYGQVEHAALELIDLIEARTYERVEVIRHVPAERLGSTIALTRLWPPAPGHAPARNAIEVRPRGDGAELVRHLLAEELLMGLYEASVESFISEQRARIVAMRQAHENAERIVEELTRASRNARQHEITSSLLEIIAGYEAAGAGGSAERRPDIAVPGRREERR